MSIQCDTGSQIKLANNYNNSNKFFTFHTEKKDRPLVEPKVPHFGMHWFKIIDRLHNKVI